MKAEKPDGIDKEGTEHGGGDHDQRSGQVHLPSIHSQPFSLLDADSHQW